MKKAIVTTTINSPTEATLRFAKIAQRDDWNFIIVGDTKTPHNEYLELSNIFPNVKYLTPEYQQETYPEISELIGWKTIQRRNIGFIEAYATDNQVIASVDDDNLPNNDWGKNCLIGQTIEVDIYKPKIGIFDPLSITKDNYIWHRGFPIQYLKQRHNIEYKGKTTRIVLIQADLWNGDPDIDAMARLSLSPIVKYSDITEPYCSDVISPFNSQNTFFHRKVIPFYAVLPFVGRMDDIWGGYIAQKYFPNSLIYSPASVYQDRNQQDLITNLENEIIGYRNTVKLVNDLDNFEQYLPENTLKFWKLYRQQFS